MTRPESPIKYPVYIPSKGRAVETTAVTFRALKRDAIPFYAVVEPREVDAYCELVGAENVLQLPFNNLGLGSIPARNFIWEHALAAGHERHWQLDDNIREFRMLDRGRRIPADAALALGACEEFTDRYSNVAISGLNYQMFVMESTPNPFTLNCHVYSCTLIRNDLPFRWRGRYNEDTDLCLQALASGECTVLINQFMADKLRTMTQKGGNSAELYQGDGRHTMAEELARAWPGVVEVKRRYGRPQHYVDWRKFDTPLIRKASSAGGAVPKTTLREVETVKSASLRRAFGLDAAEPEA